MSEQRDGSAYGDRTRFAHFVILRESCRKSAAISALTAMQENHHFAESRRITQFPCPKLTEIRRRFDSSSTASRKAQRKLRKHDSGCGVNRDKIGILKSKAKSP